MNGSLNLSAIPKEYPQQGCSNNNSIIIVDTTKNEVISVIDDTTVFEQPVPEETEKKDDTMKATTSKSVQHEKATTSKIVQEEKANESDDDIEFIPDKMEIIDICDDTVLPSPKQQEEEDSSSDEDVENKEQELDEGEQELEAEEQELEAGELNDTKKLTPRKNSKSQSVICLDENDAASESIVEISDDDDENDNCWGNGNGKVPDFLSLDVRKPIKNYVEDPVVPRPQRKKEVIKRQVVIDGSNVAFAHGRDASFSVKGITIAAKYFEEKGHEIFIVIPQFRRQKTKSSDPEGIEKLFKDGKMYFSPSKNLPGQSSSSYDDRFILQMAHQMDAAVLSNDNYRDLIPESKDFENIIKTRVIPYTFCKDLFMVPTDPYGRWGPSLKDILEVTRPKTTK